ncbi:hypothetical protein GCM10025883_07660 [Mobilicoccus caccae]|uniref:Glycosyltransferase subfamily 4-like N-terminal domain-containing protein n=1 Tax=Mobilicoccus caccae TaxID=1859295 RepID=A0ABQ6IMR0_9MICO|nr:hypothetical protein GCM10025883_07660 [Mobilicoccus caccae]
MTVAYLTSQYPALSHTFIEREVRAVRAAGVDVATFSVRPCPPEDLKSAAMLEDAETTPTLRGSSLSTWAEAHARLARRNPRVLAAGLRRALASGPRTPKGRTWQLFYLAEAVLLYERLRERGITHVHAHFANVACDVARLVTHLGRTEDGPDSDWRWSFTMHGPTEFEAVDAFDLPAKVRSADGVSCISDFCRSQLMRFVEPEHWGKLDVVRMSVDAGRYHPTPQTGDAAAAPESPDRPLRLLYVGRLVPEKGSPSSSTRCGAWRTQGCPPTRASSALGTCTTASLRPSPRPDSPPRSSSSVPWVRTTCPTSTATATCSCSPASPRVCRSSSWRPWPPASPSSRRRSPPSPRW